MLKTFDLVSCECFGNDVLYQTVTLGRDLPRERRKKKHWKRAIDEECEFKGVHLGKYIIKLQQKGRKDT